MAAADQPHATNNNNNKTKKCGLSELWIFVAAVVCGTAGSVCNKTMLGLHGVGMTGQPELFSKPLFQTLAMFVGMTFALVVHQLVVRFQIPFPGYGGSGGGGGGILSNNNNNKNDDMETSQMEQGEKPTSQDAERRALTTEIPARMYFYLAVPAIFDFVSTALGFVGLLYLDVSTYQILRGSVIIFVALLKPYFLSDRLYKFQWIGVAYNVASAILVGTAAMLNNKNSHTKEVHHQDVPAGKVLMGVLMVLLGSLVHALQYVIEEKVMTMDVPSSPLLVVGMEGFWGTLLCILVVYPLAYYLPGSDHGSFESIFNTWHMFWNSSTIQFFFFIYFFTIFGYNMFATLVTYVLDSVWHAIMDNFRPVSVWGMELWIYYFAAGAALGEPWKTWSFLQLLGMFVLLYGTAVYNAPNAGSILLKGKWYHLGFDCSKEYREMEEKRNGEWREPLKAASNKKQQQQLSSSFHAVSSIRHWLLASLGTNTATLKTWNVISGIAIVGYLILYLVCHYILSIRIKDSSYYATMVEMIRAIIQNRIVQGALTISVVVQLYTNVTLYQARQKMSASKKN